MNRAWPLLLVGCGSAAATPPPPGPADGGGDVATDAPADTAPEHLGTGRIDVTQLKTSATTMSATTKASFARNIPTTAPATCSRGSVGPCAFVACDPAPPPESPAYESAGALTLEGGLLLAPLAVGKTSQTYGHSAINEPYFKGGDDLRVKATGDVVPPFELSVTTPEELSVSKPTCTLESCGELDRSRDYELVWTPLRFGTVDVSILTNAPGKGYALVTCSAPATDGRLVIPAEVLGKLRGDATASAINIFPRSTETATVGGWKLELVATANGPYASIAVK